jgi:hypothetical protein
VGRGVLMATELDDVQSLLERLLPDPAGFAQRLAVQVMSRWGQSAGPATSAFYTDVTAEAGTPAATVITPDWAASEEPPVNMNILLAAALGACECWGMRTGCGACQGHGSPGWTEPDPELFAEFVEPAVARCPVGAADQDQEYATTPSSQAGS